MSTTIKEDLEMILEKLDRLERMIGKSTGHFEYPGDNTPQPSYPTNPFPYIANSTVCSKCGLEFKVGATSYYCPDNNCPTFLKTT